MRTAILALAALVSCAARPAFARLVSHPDAPVRIGHYHLNVTSVEADLPGVGYSLNFFRWEGDQTITHVPAAGRVVDHVGFEVKNLGAFCKALEAKGIKAIRPYNKKDVAMNNIATTTIVDPWGVSIELTEGLEKIK
jgi:hypothetical protein